MVVVGPLIQHVLVLKTSETSGSGSGCGKGRIGRGGRLKIKMMIDEDVWSPSDGEMKMKMSGHPQVVRLIKWKYMFLMFIVMTLKTRYREAGAT